MRGNNTRQVVLILWQIAVYNEQSLIGGIQNDQEVPQKHFCIICTVKTINVFFPTQCSTYRSECGFFYWEDLSVCGLCPSASHFCPANESENEISSGVLQNENVDAYTFLCGTKTLIVVVLEIWSIRLNIAFIKFNARKAGYCFHHNQNDDKNNNRVYGIEWMWKYPTGIHSTRQLQGKHKLTWNLILISCYKFHVFLHNSQLNLLVHFSIRKLWQIML